MKINKLASTMGSFGSSLLVGFCPVCIPAIGGLLSAIGLGFLVNETVLKPILIVFLGISLFGFYWSFKKEHKHLSPLIIGTIMAIALYIGRYIYFDPTFNLVLMYGGIAGLLGAGIWNLILRKSQKCSACPSK